MRLGLLGPADDDLAGLARAAEFLLNVARVDRAIYLGGAGDDALEETVERWAEALVGGDPSDEGVWARAIDVALAGSASQLDEFLRAERGRRRLKSLEALPKAGLRSVEMFGDRVAVLIHDKALLDEEDIFSATFLIYGKSDLPLVRKIGARWFLTPGKISPEGGRVMLDDEEDDVMATFYDAKGNTTKKEPLPVMRTAKLRVLGDV